MDGRSRKRIAILTEAGGTVGYGHLARMDELARGFEAAAHDVTVIVQWEGGHGQDGPIQREGIWWQQWRKVSKITDLCETDLAIIDSYLLPPHVYTQFAKAGLPIVAIDDFYRLDAGGVTLVNPNCFGDAKRYPRARSVVTGPQHVIVRRAVVSARSNIQPAHLPRTAVVTLGGADRRGLGMKVGCWLAEAGYFTSVITSSATDDRPCERDLSVITHCDEAAFISKLQAAELVICGGGQTLIEAIVLGCNVIPIEMGECHRPMIQFLLDTGLLAKRIHFTMAAAREKILNAAAIAVATPRSSHPSAALNRLIDGKGTERIVAAICDLIEPRST